MKSLLILVTIFIASYANAEALAGSKFKKVLIIVLENTDYEKALKQPYLQSLTTQGALLQNMNGMVHPSQGNYIAMVGGDTLQVKNDNPVDLSQSNVADLLEPAGLSWKAYVENFPGNCFTGATNGRYARKHNPFISFTNISQNPQRCANIKDSRAFDQDAQSGNLPNFAIYSPNLDDDGHDTGAPYSSNWLQKTFAARFADPNFMKDLLVMITFDESGSKPGNHIYTVLLGDSVIPGSKSNQALNHVSLLKTVEVELNLGDLGRLDQSAETIQGIWK